MCFMSISDSCLFKSSGNFASRKSEGKKPAISVAIPSGSKKRKAEVDLSDLDDAEEDIAQSPLDPDSEATEFAAALDDVAEYGSRILKRIIAQDQKTKTNQSK